MPEVRRTRQWSFLIVESVLVVLSILLAFTIDAAWDSRQQAVERMALLQALRADFAATDESLDAAIAEAALLISQAGGYLEAVVEDRPLPRDSVLHLLRRSLGGFAFYEPSLASYRNAVSAGSVNSVRDPELLMAFTDFELAEGHYNQIRTLAGEMYFLGAVQELRTAAGGFSGPFSDYGWRETVPREDWSNPRSLVPLRFDLRANEAVAAAEAVYWAHMNAWDGLTRMDSAAQRVVQAVDAMLAGQAHGSS